MADADNVNYKKNSMRIYRSTLSPIFVLILVVVILVLISSFFIIKNETGEEIPVQIKILFGLIIALFVWMLLDTNYKIKENVLLYCSGPIRGKIDIHKINRVEHVKTWYVTSLLKPALGSHGLTVTYNKFDDIYISPRNKAAFIAELLKVNPNIQITN